MEAVVLEWTYGWSMWENSVRVTVWGMYDPDSDAFRARDENH
jgi:hypothetical protein